MAKEKQTLLKQEPTTIKKGLETDFFNTHGTIDEIIKILKIKDVKEGVQIIGLFDAFGEGKSSLIKTMKEEHKEDFCFLEFDLWKYEDSELKHDFHKVFRAEKANYFDTGNMLNKTFGLGQKFRTSKGVANILATKRMFEHQYTEKYFGYGIQEKVRRKKKESCNQLEKTPIIVIENMDRLSTEEKITALTSIYNYREYFESHIIIALDPDSVRNSTSYFESLVHKCFTAYMYLSPKTKHTLKQYIRKQLPKISNEKEKTKVRLEKIYSTLTDMLLTQYPISLREVNHCINTYVMSFVGKGDCNLKLFMAILQVQYHKLYRAISQNPYILKKFIHHANDSAFNGYSDYNIDKKQTYKLNLLIKSLGNLDFENKEMLTILSPLNKEFLEKEKYDLYESIIYIELLRKAQLEKDVIAEIEKTLKENKFTVDKLDRFLTEVIKDRVTFITFFESQSFEEIDTKLQVFKGRDSSSFLETILSYNIEKINDYTFYDNYTKTMKVFRLALKVNKYGHLLTHRILENFQLARKLIEDKITNDNKIESGIKIEDSNYFVLKLKRLSFIKKILYTTHFFEATDSTTILTLEDIITHSIRDLDIKKFESIEKFKQNSIEKFYLEAIPTDRYELATVNLIIDIIESQLFESVTVSKKVNFYKMVFENKDLTKDNSLGLIIQKFSLLLNELFLIEDLETVIEILEKIKFIKNSLYDIHPLLLKKFVSDNSEAFGKYDDELNKRLLCIKS